jgi:glycosyltransferase involved in cell wall biosynthesis
MVSSIHKKSSVTVGIPFHNKTSPCHFRTAVDSILAQTYQPDEIHLIQDGPIPSSLSIQVTHYTNMYRQVRHLIITENKGLPYALNFSILATTSYYYARMDSDDIAHPQRLQRQVTFLDNHPDIDILGTWCQEFSYHPTEKTAFLRKLPTEQKGISDIFHYRNPLAHPSVIFRRKAFAKIGLYDTKFLTDQDLYLWAKSLNMQIGISNIPEVLLYLRVNGVIQRRSELNRIIRQAKARYSYNTWSIKLNVLKIATLGMRLMPYPIREWAYRNIRKS